MVESLAFIDARLQAAHDLLHATHYYVKWQAPLDVKHMNQSQTFKVSCEAMRITVRLTQIIAWLIIQKAIVEGDITRTEGLSDECQVLRGNHCLESFTETDEDLPYRLRELLKDSREHYLRIKRLDQMTRQRDLSPPVAQKVSLCAL